MCVCVCVCVCVLEKAMATHSSILENPMDEGAW